MKPMRMLWVAMVVMISGLAHAGLVIWGDGFMMTVQEPSGWVASSDAGRADGLPVVLFQTGSTWQTSPVVMYARVVKTSKDLASFIVADERDFQRNCPGIQISNIGPVEKRFACSAGSAPNTELVHYARVAPGILVWVMSARTGKDLARYTSDFHKVVATATCEAVNASQAKDGKSH